MWCMDCDSKVCSHFAAFFESCLLPRNDTNNTGFRSAWCTINVGVGVRLEFGFGCVYVRIQVLVYCEGMTDVWLNFGRCWVLHSGG